MDPAHDLEIEIEGEEVLAALPTDVREMVVWDRCERKERWLQLEQEAAGRWKRPVLEGAGLYLSAMAFVTGFDLGAMIAGLLLGALIGFVWHLTRAGQLLAPIIAMPAFMLLMMLEGNANLLAFLCGPFPLGIIASIMGLQRSEAIIC